MVCASLALERARRSVQLSQREFLDLGVDFLPLEQHPCLGTAPGRGERVAVEEASAGVCQEFLLRSLGGR
jgi:hypothetical protein